MKDLDRRIRQGGDDAIAAVGELLPRWIRVEERLPYANCKVLAYGFQKHPVVCSFLIEDKSFRDGGKVDGVTHWMPLPEPPEVT